MLIPNARFILATSDVEAPLTGILDTPVTAGGMGESLHAHIETADVAADLNRLVPIANAMRRETIVELFEELVQFGLQLPELRAA